MDGKIPFSRQDYLWSMAQWPSSRTLVAKNIWRLEQEEFTGPQLSPDWKLYYYAKSYIFHCFRTGVVSLCGDVKWSQAALGGLRPMQYFKMSCAKVHHRANSEWPVDSKMILKHFLRSEPRRSEPSASWVESNFSWKITIKLGKKSLAMRQILHGHNEGSELQVGGKDTET